MSDFRWHLMAEEHPVIKDGDFEAKGHYMVLGVKGGMYYARSYSNAAWGEYFCDTRGRYIDTRKIRAWIEIPPFEEAE